MPQPKTLRVLVVDDSTTVRAVLRRLFGRTPDIAVVGEASDGARAVEETIRLAPDVVLMDIEMPIMDGFVATSRIMAVKPTPILVLTSRANRNQVEIAFEAIRHGALEVLAKPEDTAGWENLAATLPVTVRAAAQVRSAPARGPSGAATPPWSESVHRAGGQAVTPELRPGRPVRFVAIGASTGGPSALHAFLGALPPEPPAPVLVVQHIASGFEEGLADWLAKDLQRDVRVARDGEVAEPGSVRVGPPGAHLRLAANGVLRLDTATPPRGGHRPAVDELFLSCAETCPHEVAGVLLSGMGADGADGLLALRRAGGLTMVQDEASSVIFGMPRAALERGAAEIALAPTELARLLARHWHGGQP
jgi:two-component system chemotaxis response regulator CheB